MTDAFKPHIYPTNDPSLAAWACRGLGVTGYGANEARAYAQWQAGLDVSLTVLPTDTHARRLYETETANDPQVHCNRFPSWSELSADERDVYRRRVAKQRLDDLEVQR